MANGLFYRRRENESQYQEPFYLKHPSIRIEKGPLFVKRAALLIISGAFLCHMRRLLSGHMQCHLWIGNINARLIKSQFDFLLQVIEHPPVIAVIDPRPRNQIY
jgi:hypothetical protein